LYNYYKFSDLHIKISPLDQKINSQIAIYRGGSEDAEETRMRASGGKPFEKGLSENFPQSEQLNG